MPRFIDAEMACDEVDKGDLLVGNNAEFAKEIIRRTPSVDVVGVTRCKDCVWWEARAYGSTIGRCENPRNGLATEYVEVDDYCSYGERKK